MMPFQHKEQVVHQNADDEPMRLGDAAEEFDLLDAVVADMFDAMERKDRALLRDALEALCDYIMQEDEVQDHSEFETHPFKGLRE